MDINLLKDSLKKPTPQYLEENKTRMSDGARIRY